MESDSWHPNDGEPFGHLHPVLNNTKWEELRLAMLDLDLVVPWRCKVLGRSFISGWDGEWHSHFRDGPYDDIEWTELKVAPADRHRVLAALAVHAIPYEVSAEGVTVFGYIDDTGRLSLG